MSARHRLLPEPERRFQPDFSLSIVNIVLLLILFFLATGALVNTPDQGINISETRDLEVDQLPPPVLIVNSDRSLVLDGQPITRSDLTAAVAEDGILHVLIDRRAPALDLLELLSAPGMNALEIRLVTIHRRDPS